jgi:hypothetical protein
MRHPRRAWAAWLLVALASAASAGAEIRTDRLAGGRLKAWREITAVVHALDAEGRPLHPTLHRLWREVDSSRHVLQVELPRRSGSSAIAGRFRIESLAPDGRLEATLILNLRAIDAVLTGSPDAQLVPFEAAGKAERRAQVLGHELAHAAWAFAAEDRARLALATQTRAEGLALMARTVGTASPGFGAAVDASERMIRLLEEPALAAESVIARELVAGRAVLRRK